MSPSMTGMTHFEAALLFALFSSLAEAQPVYQALLHQGRQVWLARTVSRAEAQAVFG